MSRRNISQLHQLLVSITIHKIRLSLSDQAQLFAVAKAGKLISSKRVSLELIGQDMFPASTLILDVVVPYNKETGKYESKQIRVNITNGNKKSIIGTILINLADHINLQSKIQFSSMRQYRLQQCEDKEGIAHLSIKYEQSQLKSSSTLIRSMRQSIKTITENDHSKLSCPLNSQSVLEESMVIQKSGLFASHSSKQNISPDSPSDVKKRLRQDSTNQSPRQYLMSPEQKSIIQNLSIISNECNVLHSIMKRNPTLEALQQQNAHLNQTKQHMKNQIESLQYLNGVLLEQQTNKEREIEYLQSQLDKAYKLIDRFKNNMELSVVQDLKDQVDWLRDAKEIADQELNKVKQQNESLLCQSRIMKSRQQQLVEKSRLKERSVLKNEDSMRLSLQFNKLKKYLLQEYQNKDQRRTLELMNPLQKAIESVWMQY